MYEPSVNNKVYKDLFFFQAAKLFPVLCCINLGEIFTHTENVSYFTRYWLIHPLQHNDVWNIVTIIFCSHVNSARKSWSPTLSPCVPPLKPVSYNLTFFMQSLFMSREKFLTFEINLEPICCRMISLFNLK